MIWLNEMTAIGDHTKFSFSIDFFWKSFTNWYVAYFMCFLYASTYFRSGLVFMKGLGAVPVGGPVLVRLNSLVKWRILWIWCTLKFTNFLNQISGQPWIKTQRRKFRQAEIFNLKLWVKVLVIFGLSLVFKMDWEKNSS